MSIDLITFPLASAAFITLIRWQENSFPSRAATGTENQLQSSGPLVICSLAQSITTYQGAIDGSVVYLNGSSVIAGNPRLGRGTHEF